LENLKGTNHLEELGIDERIISQWILKNQGKKVWVGFIWHLWVP
jgi:hypothetical protein